MTNKSFLVFEDQGVSPSGLTRRVVVKNTGGTVLGHISWHGQWRRYTFVPSQHDRLIFDHRCLLEIAAALDGMTAGHKAGRKLGKSKSISVS